MRTSKRRTRRWLFLILIIAILFTYGWPWAVSRQVGSTNADITIAFKGAGSGLDPQGNRFNINELKNDDILKKAIDDSGLTETLTVDELKRRLFILPQAELDTLKELLTLTSINGKTQDIKERIIYPTTFTVGIKDMDLPSLPADKALLNGILKAYDEHLKARYLSDLLSEPAYSQEEILKMDYPEMMMVLNQEAESLLLYIDSYAANEPQFVSGTTGLSFADVYQQAVLLKDTDIGTMRSLVNYYELTDDTPGRILYEQAMLKRAGVVASKLEGAQYFTYDILQIYDNNSNYIFPPGGSGSVSLEPVENRFYGELVSTLVDKQAAYINAKYDQQDILDAIAKLQAGSISGDAWLQLTEEIKSGTVDALERIAELSRQTSAMAEEVYEGSIRNKIYIGPAKYSLNSNGNIIINFAVLAALYFLVRWFWQDLKRSGYSKYFSLLPFRRKRNAK
jgi:hypothetical protein